MDDMGEHRPAVIDYRNRCGKRASRDALRALLPVVRSGRLMLDLRDARGQAKAKVPAGAAPAVVAARDAWIAPAAPSGLIPRFGTW
jgi:hypothetical protein